MTYNYLESEEFKRRFENKEAYELSLKFQSDMANLGIAWHNTFSDECTVDFSCCCGTNLEGCPDYHTYIPSNYTVVKLALEELFEKVKHGDNQHQDWLKNEFKKYLNENY